MIYYHLSNNKLENKVFNEQKLSLKPNGIWFSKKNLWNNFLKSENMNMKYKYEYKLRINFDNILTLSSYDDIIEFEKKYGKYVNKIFVIDWKKVQKKYDGIYFDNYENIVKKIWNNTNYKSKTDMNRILKFTWYFSIDIESGCLFNPKPIIKII